jgi:hypothetical protein
MTSSLHEGLLRQLTNAYGSIGNIEPLGGKSGANVYRLHFAQTSRIAKRTSRSAEVLFYENIAPILSANEIPIPEAEVVLHSGWIVLEDIPHPLPRELWHGDTRLVKILARLHSLNIDIPALRSGYSLGWTDDLNEKMLACFEPETARQLKPKLIDIQHQSQPLFEKECWISGDPNPTNWGLRHDGSLVLFDWDRFTRATPAIDMAIIVGGLGNRQQFTEVAATYLHEREKIGHPYWQTDDRLGHNIAIAKLWTVVEYLSLYTDGQLEPDTTLEMLRDQFSRWLDSLDILTG